MDGKGLALEHTKRQTAGNAAAGGGRARLAGRKTLPRSTPVDVSSRRYTTRSLRILVAPALAVRSSTVAPDHRQNMLPSHPDLFLASPNYDKPSRTCLAYRVLAARRL